MRQLRVLVIGGGGREDALVWKIGQSPLVSEIYCAPGNAGISQRPKTKCLPEMKANDLWPLRDFAKGNRIDLTVVGPEAPLVAGIVDGFEAMGLKIVGPTKTAAQIEGSKVFAKEFMERNKIPTADFMIFDDPERAKRYAKANLPCVTKADGLAAGKSVIPCFNDDDIATAIKRIMLDKEFKEAGDRIVIEDFLAGEEATFKVLTDGREAIPLLATQDHKPVNDGDKGPNTGGMGAYAPVPVITKELEKRIMEEIIDPTLAGMRTEGRPYKGCLYAGLMITLDGPKVLEFNCRFGDPELQPVVPLMENDIVPILEGIAEGELPEEEIKWSEGAVVCVVMTSGGYPGEYKPDKEIKGLEEVAKMGNVEVFHAGTTQENGIWKTAGGRVLGVTAKAKGIPEAIDLAYEAVAKISWDGEHHRTDIGQKAIERHGIQIKMGLSWEAR